MTSKPRLIIIFITKPSRMNSGRFVFVPPEKFWHLPKILVTEDFLVLGVMIPKGFESDGASVPRALPLLGLLCVALGHCLLAWFYVLAVIFLLALAVFPRFGLSINAALLHDYLLQKNINNWWQAGVLFYRQMLIDGVPKAIAWLAWFFVTVWQFYFSLRRYFYRG